ncbi:MAG: diaminopimelate epimerase [Chloroflexi bacterium]|nr:diaminopimelate epimerase [Chloroflexota bacterium]
MKFTKMHGAGNDFVMIDARRMERDWKRLAIAMCDRHFGVGADGIILVKLSKRHDFRMQMYNPDGSESEMCGNGIRTFAKFVIDQGIAPKSTKEMQVETLAGLQVLTPKRKGGEITRVVVNMGTPKLAAKEIPIALDGMTRVVDQPLEVDGRKLAFTGVSMGNPHAVVFLKEKVKDWPLEVIGPKVERHALFPHRVNFEIVNVLDRTHLDMRVWERGAGLTLACGTGACAVAVAAQLKGLTEQTVHIHLPGGDLKITWDGKGDVFMEGPAETVFNGEWAE